MSLVYMFGNKIPAAGGGVDPVRCLLHMDGADLGKSFPDSSTYGNNATASGAAVTSTTTPKFGTAAFTTSGTGYLFMAHNANMQPGTGDFSVDFWTREKTTWANIQTFWAKGETTDSDKFMLWQQNGLMYLEESGVNVINAVAHGISVGSWGHVELSNTGGTIKLFVDGVEKASVASTFNYLGGTAPTEINRSIYNVTYADIDIDEWRLQIGTGVGHTSGFTPPTAPY